MRPALFLCAMMTVALAALPAKADTFTISFNGDPLGYSGSGTFVGNVTSPGIYLITAVVPGGTVTDPGFGSSSVVGVSSYLGADNLLYFPNSGNYFDNSGLSFMLANGVNINLYNFIAGSTLFQAALESSPNGDIPEFVTETVTHSTVVAPTPEPASFVLLSTSALAAAEVLRKRLSA